MSLDYPLYEEMKRRGSSARYFWRYGDWLYYFGLLVAIIWPLASSTAVRLGAHISFFKVILIWLVFVALFFIGGSLKKVSYTIAKRDGIDISRF